MEKRSRGRFTALMFFAVWVVAVVAASYRLLDAGVDIMVIPVVGLVSFIIMLIGTMMYLSSFQNLNAAMVREFHEVEIPSLSRFMGSLIWLASVIFYCVFALAAPMVGTGLAAVCAVAFLVVFVLCVTVYSSRSGRFEKD